MFIDVHCHLDFCEKEGTLSTCIERARAAGVTAMVAQGVNPTSNRRVLELARRTGEVKAALGLYPIDALAMNDAEIEKELNFIREKRNEIIALGEVGLDFKEQNSLRAVENQIPQDSRGFKEDEKEHERQKDIFKKIIALAAALQKPLIVHSRKAETECIEMLQEQKAEKVIMHCFSGKWKLVEQIVANGWYLTIPTSVVSSEHFQRIAREIPLKNLFCETDAPYLHPDKAWPNEPSLVVRSYQKLAEIKGIPLDDVKAVLARNYEKVFGKR